MQFLLLLNNSGWWWRYKFMNNFSMLINNLTMLISHLITINVGCGLNFIYINKFIHNHFRIIVDIASWGIKIILLSKLSWTLSDRHGRHYQLSINTMHYSLDFPSVPLNIIMICTQPWWSIKLKVFLWKNFRYIW